MGFWDGQWKSVISNGSWSRMQWRDSTVRDLRFLFLIRFGYLPDGPGFFYQIFTKAGYPEMHKSRDPNVKQTTSFCSIGLFGTVRTLADAVRPGCVHSTLVSPYNNRYVLQKWNMFYIWMANWTPFENMLILLFQQRFFIFNNFRKWHLCIGRHRNRYSSQSVILNHL